MVSRIYVEKRPGFDVAAKGLAGELHDIVSRHLPLACFGEVTQPLMRNSIGALGSSFRYLFVSYPEVRNPSARYRHYLDTYLHEGAFMNDRDLSHLVADREFAHVFEATGPVVYHSDTYECTTLVCNVRIDGALCACVVTNDLVEPLTKRDDVIVCQLARYLGERLADEDLYELTHPEHVREVLEGLVHHHLLPEQRIQKLLDTYEWNMHDTFAVALLRLVEESDYRKALEPLALSLARLTLNDCYLIEQDTVVFPFDLTHMRLSYDELVELVGRHVRDLPLEAAISSPFEDFKDLYYYCRQAHVVQEAARSKDPTNDCVTAEAYAIDYLLAKLTQKSTAGTVVPRELASLLRYDRAHSTSHVHLLRVYLDNDRNVAATVRQEYIHRNTFGYRLRKIEEITGLDLDDADVRLRLGIGLRMLEREGLIDEAAPHARQR